MKSVKASTTVELAYMMPVVFLSCIAVIYITFYMHDKNILIGAAYETAVVGTQKVRWEEPELNGQLQQLFQERTKGKFLFFSSAEAEIELDEKTVIVRASAIKKRMKISAEERATVTDPEKYIRDIRRIQNAWKQNINGD